MAKNRRSRVKSVLIAPISDVLCLFEHCFGRDRQALIVHGAGARLSAANGNVFSLLKKRLLENRYSIF